VLLQGIQKVIAPIGYSEPFGITARDRKQLNAIRHLSSRPLRSGKAGNSGRFLQDRQFVYPAGTDAISTGFGAIIASI
jgi:hypothetical protein